jgi:hypothetical protein
MSQVVIPTQFHAQPASEISSLRSRADSPALEHALQEYAAAQRWTLGSLLANVTLAVMTAISGRGDVGKVLFGGPSAAARRADPTRPTAVGVAPTYTNTVD